MEDKAEQNKVTHHEMLGKCDEILISHIERLIGTNQGIDGLQMNLTTVSCLVLFATRETEIEAFPHLPPERYTDSKLAEELTEMSIEIGDDLNKWLQDMVDKAYLKLYDGRYFAEKPAISMSQLLDKIFPQMPGLNLIAYLGQILDEVEAGRKGTDIASTQLYQMLEIQGVPLGQEKKNSKPAKKRFEHLKEAIPDPKKTTKATSIVSKPSDIFSKLQTRTIPMTPKPDKSETPEETPELQIQSNEVEKISKEDILSGEVITKKQLSDNETTEKQACEEPLEKQDNKDDETTLKESTAHEEEKNDPESVKPEEEETILKEALVTDDEDIEKKIAAFEEALGMTCPICVVGSIHSKETTKGKIYYHCSNEECNFISWGKPFYIECPQCTNPFLIEASNRNGDNILKCARTTCHYWRKYPWEMEEEEKSEKSLEPKKKVLVRRKPRKKVRRRVVRRKKA
ncbi:hypothetical protein ACFL1Z_00410 [Thermodesulfobacteriota bacterium]